jgi:threonine aldolase
MQNRFIDLYSDTKTKPSPGMRKAMAEAEVGDEQKYEDPTVNRLRERVCELLGKEDAVFMPSGTMCNQSAIRVHCRLGDEVIADRTAHIINAETGGTAANSGVMIRMLDGPNGVFTADQVKAALRDPNSRNAPRSRLVSVENTSNGGFGTVWPLATMQGVSKVAHDAGLAMHMDGARLCNAAVKAGIKASAYAACVDSLWLDYTKGLGAPVGASLAGSKEFIREAWRQKQMLGGSMRQSGVIAAAALYALEHNWDRLAEDHDNAHHLAAGIANIKGLECEVDRMQTNLVFFEVKKPGMTGAQFVAACTERGVGMGTSAGSATRIRAVTHLDVNRADIDAALKVINDVMAA